MIDNLDLPPNVYIIKPDYISIGLAILLEIYLLIVSRQYAAISTQLMKDDDESDSN